MPRKPKVEPSKSDASTNEILRLGNILFAYKDANLLGASTSRGTVDYMLATGHCMIMPDDAISQYWLKQIWEVITANTAYPVYAADAERQFFALTDDSVLMATSAINKATGKREITMAIRSRESIDKEFGWEKDPLVLKVQFARPFKIKPT